MYWPKISNNKKMQMQEMIDNYKHKSPVLDALRESSAQEAPRMPKPRPPVYKATPKRQNIMNSEAD